MSLFGKRFECNFDIQYDDATPSNSPPLSDHTPIIGHPALFGYNTFETCPNATTLQFPPSYSFASSKPTSIVSQPEHEHAHDVHSLSDCEYEHAGCGDTGDKSSDAIYTDFGRAYRRWCFSVTGIKLTMLLNATLIVVNTSLIGYEIALMVSTGSFSLYSDDRLPLIFLVFDVVVTLILLVEISLHLTAIYNCAMCHYWRYSHDHKLDVLVFFVSLFLCTLYVFDVFGQINDINNMGFLLLRVIRDIMRLVRCVIFAKFLYDSIVQLRAPQKQQTCRSRTRRRRRRRNVSMSSCSSGWDNFKIGKPHEMVCL